MNKKVYLISLLVTIVLVSGAGCTDTQPAPTQPTKKPNGQPTTCTSFEYSNWSQCTINGTQGRSVTKSKPEGCSGGNPTISQNCELDVSILTTQTINKIVKKIKSNPNTICGNSPCVKTSYDSGVANVTLIYEVSSDPLEPGSKEALILEIDTDTYMDENGKQLPQNKTVQDVFMFRDTDFDAMPNDYWSNDFGQDLNFKTLTNNTPDVFNLLTLWTAGINYFVQNLL